MCGADHLVSMLVWALLFDALGSNERKTCRTDGPTLGGNAELNTMAMREMVLVTGPLCLSCRGKVFGETTNEKDLISRPRRSDTTCST